METKTVDVGEVHLEYSLTGPPRKPVILFLHGLSGNLSQFTAQEQYFSKDCSVLLLSLRGHGRSSYPKPAVRETFSLKVMAGDILSLLDRLEVPAVHWVGNSLGGLLGYQMLQDAPGRLNSLAVFGITASQHYSPILVALLTYMKDLVIMVKGYEGFCRMAGPVAGKLPETREKVVEMALKTAPEAQRYAHMTVASVNFLQVLAGAKIPLLHIKGEHDGPINKALGSTLRVLEGMENAEIIEMPGVGHYANLDRPAEFNALLDGWYSRIARIP